MEETVMLIILAFLMLIGSYLSGSIPLSMTMSEECLQTVSVLGAGLLVGTALAVIIPEGVRSLGSAFAGHLEHKVSEAVSSNPAHLTEGVIAHHHEHSHVDPHSLIGIFLVLGFVFMLLVDQCSTARSRDVEGGGKSAERNITATLGLVVHAAVDGVALGAAATTAHTEVEMIVFIAIMLHKAPAAFGLVTFLLHEGLDRNRIRRHLLVFSFSAPVSALLTYFFIGQEGKKTLSSLHATGTAMLFSAGTFLYVATVHVLPELTSRGHSHDGMERKHLNSKELACLVVGALLPVFLSAGHHH